MRARILYRDSHGRDGSVALEDEQPCFVGRALDCAIRTDDAMVSRKHSIIRMENGRFWVEDLGSSNGTHVNERRVHKHALLHNDVVRCGSLWLRYIEDEEQPALQNLPTEDDEDGKQTRPADDVDLDDLVNELNHQQSVSDEDQEVPGMRPLPAALGPGADPSASAAVTARGRARSRPREREREREREQRPTAQPPISLPIEVQPPPAAPPRPPTILPHPPSLPRAPTRDISVSEPAVIVSPALTEYVPPDPPPPPRIVAPPTAASTPTSQSSPVIDFASLAAKVDRMHEEVAHTRARLAEAEESRRQMAEQLEEMREDNQRLRRELERGSVGPEPTLDQSSEATAQVDPARNPAALQDRALEVHDRLTRILRNVADNTARLRAQLELSEDTLIPADTVEALAEGTEKALAVIDGLKKLAGVRIDD